MEDKRITIVTDKEKEQYIQEYKDANKICIAGAIGTTLIIPTVLSGLLMASCPVMTQFDFAQSWCAFTAFTAGVALPLFAVMHVVEVNRDKQDNYHKGCMYLQQQKLQKKAHLRVQKQLKQSENCK